MNHFAAKALCQFNSHRFFDPSNATVRAPVAISACLLGERVRYDGADQKLASSAQLAQALQLIPICPEVGAGLAVPRPPVQLVDTGAGIRARGRDDTTLDVTAALESYAQRSIKRFEPEQNLCGYIWKSRSPSCGFGSTPVFGPTGEQLETGFGIQASAFRQRLPWLHCAEETNLSEPMSITCFVLICRLLFDLLRAKSDELHNAHSHYHLLRARLPEDSQKQLEERLACGDSAGYLVAFQHACNQTNREELLEIFTR